MSAVRLTAIRVGVLEALGRLASRAWFAYVTLDLLQLKVMWDMWQYRDLTAGDEASYYNRAFLWFNPLSASRASDFRPHPRARRLARSRIVGPDDRQEGDETAPTIEAPPRGVLPLGLQGASASASVAIGLSV